MKNKLSIKKYLAVALLTAAIFISVGSSQKTLAASLTVENVYSDVNQARIQNGVVPLVKNEALTIAAQRKAQDMLAYGYWAHFNPVTGASPWKFMMEAGYKFRYAGENLAKDYGDTIPLMSAWMNSPTHRKNIVSGNFKETGIAIASGVVNGSNRIIIVQMFGSR